MNTITPVPAYSSHLYTMGLGPRLSALDISGMAQRYGGSGGSRPPGDFYNDPQSTSGAVVSKIGTNIGATKEPGEPIMLPTQGGTVFGVAGPPLGAVWSLSTRGRAVSTHY